MDTRIVYLLVSHIMADMMQDLQTTVTLGVAALGFAGYPTAQGPGVWAAEIHPQSLQTPTYRHLLSQGLDPCLVPRCGSNGSCSVVLLVTRLPAWLPQQSSQEPPLAKFQV